MNIERLLRLLAGLFLVLSVTGYFYVSEKFIWVILFIGINLFQSGITDWCPMMNILKLFGVKKK